MLSTLCCLAAPAAEPARGVEDSVVKIFSTIRTPDTSRPWAKQSPQEATGSGVIIEGRRILTNAHVVQYASQVLVQANQAGDKIPAEVVAVAPGIDLAVLKLEDEGLFSDHPPLPRANLLPDVKDTVMAYGFPTGGTSLSITKGIVSRIEFASYNYPVTGLRIQIDAAINPGNSGGPAVVGDRMIGLAFSTLGGTQNIGYIIPCEEIELFLKDVAKGSYTGKPAMYDELQTLENPALRAFLKLDKAAEGIVVHAPYTGGARPSVLKEWDVITRIGDTKVDDQGMVKVGANLRLHFQYLVQHLAKDGLVPLTVIRQGRELNLQMPVAPTRPMLIPDLQGTYPSYFILGPLVFSRATAQFVGASGSMMGAFIFWGSPLAIRRGDGPAFDGEELVVVASPLFPHKLAKGYDSPQGEVVRAVNGIRIRNLRHLVEVLRDAKGEFIQLDFDRRVTETEIFPRAELLAATEGILTDNGIRAQGSPDLMAVWGGK
jgi:S1-C subfamily serine protease